MHNVRYHRRVARSTDIADALVEDPSTLDAVAPMPGSTGHLQRDSAEAIAFLNGLRPTIVGLSKVFTNGLAAHCAEELARVVAQQAASDLLHTDDGTHMRSALRLGGKAVLDHYLDGVRASSLWSPLLERLDALLLIESELSSLGRFPSADRALAAGVMAAADITVQVHDLLARHAALDPTIDALASAPHNRSIAHRLAALQEERSGAVHRALSEPPTHLLRLPPLRMDKLPWERKGNIIRLRASFIDLGSDDDGTRPLDVPARYDLNRCPAITSTNDGAAPAATLTGGRRPHAARRRQLVTGTPSTPAPRRRTPGMIDRLYDAGTAIAPMTIFRPLLEHGLPDVASSRPVRRPPAPGKPGLS